GTQANRGMVRGPVINRFHAWLHRPEKGWDPVSPSHAREYGALQWGGDTDPLVDELEARLGGLRDKSVLDLGGGPGQYSVAFARRGATVTWHDVSASYREIAEGRAREAGVAVELSLGYLEQAPELLARAFDLVFVRLAWHYCADDRRFAATVHRLVKPGGAGYVDQDVVESAPVGARRRMVYALQRSTG